MAEIRVDLQIVYSDKETPKVLIAKNEVPMSVIVQDLDDALNQLNDQLIDEALEEVPEEGVNQYLVGRIKTDRQKVSDLLKNLDSPPEENNVT